MTVTAIDPPRFDPHLPYLSDGPISAVMGMVLMFAAAPFTELAGWSLPPSFLFVLGMILLPWAAFNFFLGRTARPAPALVRFNIAVDASWALGSLVLVALYWGELTPLGTALLLGQAFAVAGMFGAKMLGKRALLA